MKSLDYLQSSLKKGAVIFLRFLAKRSNFGHIQLRYSVLLTRKHPILAFKDFIKCSFTTTHIKVTMLLFIKKNMTMLRDSENMESLQKEEFR
jgi:hypothetical protein